MQQSSSQTEMALASLLAFFAAVKEQDEMSHSESC